MKTKIHAFAGALALLTIFGFWASTILSELFGTTDQIVLVKTSILQGMAVLIPALAITGGSGFSIGGKWKSPLISKKKRRMKFAAANGILILVPSAFFLAMRAQALNFDAIFYGVQAIELLAGAANITLLSLNMRDGITFSKRRAGLA